MNKNHTLTPTLNMHVPLYIVLNVFLLIQIDTHIHKKPSKQKKNIYSQFILKKKKKQIINPEKKNLVFS